jgi:hypothetical protein
LVTDQVLDTLVPSAPLDRLPELLLTRYGRLAQGVLLSPPTEPAIDGRIAEVVAALQDG